MGDHYIKSGNYRIILLVGSDLMSTIIDRTPEGRATGVLFGDGSGAVVLQESNDESQILSTHLYADGDGVEHLTAKAPGSVFNPLRIDEDIVKNRMHLPYQNGREVFKNAVKRMPEAINVALEHNNLSVDDVSLVVAHQANRRILEACAERMKLPMEKMYINIQKYGNTTAATIPIALCEAIEEGKFS